MAEIVKYQVWGVRNDNGLKELLHTFCRKKVKGDKIKRRFLFWTWEYEPEIFVYPDLAEVANWAKANHSLEYQSVFIQEYGFWNLEGSGDYCKILWIDGKWIF